MTSKTEQALLKEMEPLLTSVARSPGDYGSAPVQVVVLTARIRALADHLRRSPKDYSSRRGLLSAVNRRMRLLVWIRQRDPDIYASLCTALGLRRAGEDQG